MGWWRWALVSPDGVAPSRMVCVSASVNLPLHHKVQKFSSGTGSSGWSQIKGRKTVVLGISKDRPAIPKCRPSRKSIYLTDRVHHVQLLWLPYVIGQAIIFLPCVFFFYFFLSFFFPRLMSVVGD